MRLSYRSCLSLNEINSGSNDAGLNFSLINHFFTLASISIFEDCVSFSSDLMDESKDSWNISVEEDGDALTWK